MPTILDKQTISDPSQTELCLRVRPGEPSIQIILHTPAEQQSLVYSEIPLDPAATSEMTALEDAVYDNPLLLAEFRRVTVSYASPRSVIVPDDIDPSLRHPSLRRLYQATDTDSDPLEAPIPRAKATLLFDMPSAILNFFRRTFDNPTITHPLAVLAQYFLAENPRPAIPKIYANIRHGRADIVAIDCDGRLLCANTLPCRQPIDAVYFIVATRRLFVDPDTQPEILLCGNRTDRDAVAQILTENALDPLTVGCPSAMFRAGRDALNAPFDLITIPLCV